MSKITIELEDYEGQVAVGVTIAEFSEDSKACQMATRVVQYIESIASATSGESLVSLAKTPAIRMPDGSKAKTESGIILAH